MRARGCARARERSRVSNSLVQVVGQAQDRLRKRNRKVPFFVFSLFFPSPVVAGRCFGYWLALFEAPAVLSHQRTQGRKAGTRVFQLALSLFSPSSPLYSPPRNMLVVQSSVRAALAATSSLVVQAARASSSKAAASSVFAGTVMAPPDPILGINVAFLADTSKDKINLGVGAYRDDHGKPYLLRAVTMAEKKFDANLDHEYLPIGGLASFNNAARALAFGDNCTASKEKRVVTVQSLSGTGALSMGFKLLKHEYPNKSVPVLVPNPTWGNHPSILKDLGFGVAQYRYYNEKTNGLDIEGMLASLSAAPDRSMVLLHACAHNPTGVDPSLDQWRSISAVLKAKGHFPIVDMAYQGFASGDLDADAAPLRLLVADGHELMAMQSFAKNMGLYGQRVGALSILCKDAETTARLESQLKIHVRTAYSNPPIHGARLASMILNDPKIRAVWMTELKEMSGRIISMRKALRGALEELRSPHSWRHITDQIGMFCYTGMSEAHVKRLRDEFHVYLTTNGRISVAGVTSKNVQRLAHAMHEVTKSGKLRGQ